MDGLIEAFHDKKAKVITSAAMIYKRFLVNSAKKPH